MGFKFQENWKNLQSQAARQSNSYCLEIYHFEEITTGSVNFKLKYLLETTVQFLGYAKKIWLQFKLQIYNITL